MPRRVFRLTASALSALIVSSSSVCLSEIAVYDSEPARPALGDSAVRLVFEYEGEDVRLVSWQRIDMLTSLSDPVEEHRSEQGSWLELRDRNDRPIYRQVLHQAIQTDVEAPSDEPGHPLTRRPVEQPRGVFVALLPDLNEAETLALWYQPFGPKDSVRGTRELLRVPFPHGDQYQESR